MKDKFGEKGQKLMNQTENYIVLKPLADRFNRVASEITDDEIKTIIKSEIREQVSRIDFFGVVHECIDEYVEDNFDEILDMYKSSLKERLK